MDRPNVVFVVLDSARRDRLSVYGHTRETTPTLERFATRSTTFEHAFVPAPWTLPTHTSIFTGMAPTEHGLTAWFSDQPNQLSPDIDTLAQRLTTKGYQTAGFSNNPWVGSLTNLDRGFDDFVEWDLEIGRSSTAGLHDRRDRLYSRFHSLLGTLHRQPIFLIKRRFFTGQLVNRAIDWLRKTADGAPTFTFLNLMEAHSPYFPPREAFRELGLSPPGPIEPRVLNTHLLAYVMGHAELSDERRRRVLEYYDASLRYQDAKVAELLDTLDSLDRFDDSLVIICADHGKTLGEFDRNATPPHHLRGINTDVPLMISTPGQRTPQRLDLPVELTRLHDLILNGGAQLETTMTTDGLAMIEDVQPHTGRTTDAVAQWRAVTDGEYRYIRDENDREFLLQGDQHCDEPELLEWMGSALSERVAQLDPHDGAPGESSDPSDTVERQLSDLGYLE